MDLHYASPARRWQLIDALHVYAHYASISIRSQLHYRASFLMAAFGHAVVNFVEFLFIWVLFARFGSLNGWSLPQVALLYGMIHVSFALAEGLARGFDVFAQWIRSGDFDRILLRPRSTAFQIAASEIQIMRVGRLTQALFVLAWAASACDIDWTIGRVTLLPLAVLGGACTFAALFVFQATVAFWTVESLELANVLTYGGVETAQFPLSIYRPGFRLFFTFVVPLAAANYLPARVLLALPGVSPLHWLAPLMGLGFLACALLAWRFGVRHYRSTGS